MSRIFRFPLIILLSSLLFLLARSQEENAVKVKVIADGATSRILADKPLLRAHGLAPAETA